MKLQRTSCSWELPSFGLIEALGPNSTAHKSSERCVAVLALFPFISLWLSHFYHTTSPNLLMLFHTHFFLLLFSSLAGCVRLEWWLLRASLSWLTRDGSHTAPLFHLLINHANEILKATQMCFSREPALALAPDYSWSVHEQKGKGKSTKEIQK